MYYICYIYYEYSIYSIYLISYDIYNMLYLIGGGCERPCSDLENKVCGCMDSACTGKK